MGAYTTRYLYSSKLYSLANLYFVHETIIRAQEVVSAHLLQYHY